MRGRFKGLIPQNCAPSGVDRIGFYRNGRKEYELHLPPQMKAPSGKKLYAFGALSDVHTYATGSYSGDTTANTDFAKALDYYSALYDGGEVDFVAVCGDLTCYGSTVRQQAFPSTDFDRYASIVREHGGSMPIYAMAGNHEWWGEAIDDATMQTYTGHPLRYAFEHKGDVFILCGMASANYVFTEESVRWLYGVLEERRNRRCFLFCHGMARGYSGDPTGIYPFDILGNAAGKTFLAMLTHYRNVIYFHGHSHILYGTQAFTQESGIPNCIYDDHLGVHSVHIPSLAVPIDISGGTRVVVPAESQGYVVDVYEKEILLRGRDFVRDAFVATAIYKLDTTVKPVEENAFSDPNGLVK